MSAIILIFRCRNDALLLRSFLLANNIFAKVVDAPRQLSSSCGLAIEVPNYNAIFLQDLLRNSYKDNLVVALYNVLWRNGNRSFEKI
ncbi:MAG: DUF3343 domain-containing protein [Clostridia bacterium]